MIKNNLIPQLSAEEEAAIIRQVKEIEKYLPPRKELSPGERMTIPKLGRKNLDFVERCLLYIKKNPAFIPFFMDAAKMEEQMAFFKQMQRILSVLQPLTYTLKDTYISTGSEIYSTALLFYKTVKNAAEAGTPGCKTIAEDLGSRFKMKSRKGNSQANEEASESRQTGVAENEEPQSF